MKTYWDAGTVRGEINDITVFVVLDDYGCVSKALVEDDMQLPAGGVWNHILDMAERGLVSIENDVARRI